MMLGVCNSGLFVIVKHGDTTRLDGEVLCYLIHATSKDFVELNFIL